MIAYSHSAIAQKEKKPFTPLAFENGKLRYAPDSLGNRIPDFSFCGYRSGEQPIPDVPVKVIVPVSKGDATIRIQSAIDYVSKLPADANGFRGAVLLQQGTYAISGSLRLHTSGVVVRGSGFDSNGTLVIGAGKDRATLVQVNGKNDKNTGTAIAITDDYVPVNATTIHIAANIGIKKGDNIIITRPSTKEWIDVLGTAHFGGGITALGWKPGQRNITWIRNVTSVNGNTISFDAPFTTALDKKYGGATIAAFTWAGRIQHCGVENMQLVSAYDTSNEKDEDHRWMAITIDNANDAWVRQVQFRHFAGSAVAVYENASRVTVEDCISQQPISEIGGERRNTFFTSGQQTLFQRCYAEYGIHDFATGFCAPGPNAFVQCESKQPYSFSGGIDSWASGVLFDVVNVDGHAISYLNRGQDGQGAGWNIANGVLWNCSAARVDCYQPPTAQNWAFGTWSQFSGDGYWGESNNHIQPRSLYYAQLRERIGSSVDNRVQVMNMETEASSSPSVETAWALTQSAVSPAMTLPEFIVECARKQAIATHAKDVKTIDEIGLSKNGTINKAAILQIKNGWLVRGDKLVTGGQLDVPWWNGTAKPYALDKARPAITRFVPGRIGTGVTDDLDQLTDSMTANHLVAVSQNYGLWYDRRRDDHERVRRTDGDVWTPFYELPFARSGKETAWDGLSKYDLTKYNYWYWNRLRQFADLADQKGLVLIHQNYFQHNIIEAGAHYADFPWRTANNINKAGFPEPVPYAGDKRIFMAEQFYDTTHSIRHALHTQYIRQCLDNFVDNNGVIQLIGEEYTGPLHFTQFWLNAIRQWEAEKNKRPIIGLSTTKDVQDAILNDPAYSSLVDVIDIKYWHYQADGQVYAPKGGQNLAPRQHARLLKPKSSSPQQVYRAVLEYKLRYPGKSILYSADGAAKNGWAVLMAGGSLANVPATDEMFLRTVAAMQPQPADTASGQWVLHNEAKGYIIYTLNAGEVVADLSASPGSYEVIWINAADGSLQKNKKRLKGGKKISLLQPQAGNWVLWLRKD